MKHRKHIKSYPIRDLKVYLSKAKSLKFFLKKNTLASPQQQCGLLLQFPAPQQETEAAKKALKKRHKRLSWTVSYDNVGSRKVGKAGYGQSQKYSPRI